MQAPKKEVKLLPIAEENGVLSTACTNRIPLSVVVFSKSAALNQRSVCFIFLFQYVTAFIYYSTNKNKLQILKQTGLLAT